MFRKHTVLVSLIVSLAMSLVAGVALGAAKVRIEVMHSGFGPDPEVQRRFDEWFMKKYPNIEVKSNLIPSGTTAEKLLLMMTSGTAPDVTWVHNSYDWVAVLLKGGFLKDLTPYIERDKDFNLEDFLAPLLRNHMRYGRLYALPLTAYIQAFAVNVDFLEERGLVLPRKDWTLDDFLTYARKLTVDKSGDGVPDIWGISPYYGTNIGPIYPWNARTWLAPFGAHLFSEDRTKVLLTEPEALSAMEWWYSLGLKYKVVGGDFLKGTAGMTIQNTTGFAGKIWVDLPFNYDVVHFPKGPKGRACVVGVGGCMGIVSTTKHPEEAWTYLKEFLSTEGQKMTIPTFGPCRSRYSAWEFKFPGAPPSLKIVPDMVREYGEPIPPGAEFIHSMMIEQLAPAMKGEKPIEEAARNVKALGEKILEKWREDLKWLGGR